MIPPFVSKAGAPFSEQDADVVLRSADGIDFYAFKAHLSSASEVFNHMFSSPQPSETANEGELADGLPIVPVYDPSPVLEGLLCYCDPNIDSESWQSSVPLTDIQNLAIKYDMITVARAVCRDRIRLEREFPPSGMLGVIRQKVGQNEDMYIAAINIFTSSENEAVEMVDLGLVTLSQYDSLLRYRDECRARAVAVASPPHNHWTWMSPRYNWFRTDVEHDCNRGGNIFIANVHGKSMMRFWWREYTYEAGRRLAKRPWGVTVTSGDFFDVALKEGSRCRVCKKDLDQDFRQFTGLFASKIDDAVSQARYRSFLFGNVSNLNFRHRLYSRTYN
jgi:BTB/POZ domain